MKLLIFSLLLFTSVSHANPLPRLLCQSIRGLTFLDVQIEIVPDWYSPTGTAYIKKFRGETEEIKNLEYLSISGEGVQISGYEKKDVLKLVKTRIDGEDHGWTLSISLGFTNLEEVPMNCKIMTEIPAELPF